MTWNPLTYLGKRSTGFLLGLAIGLVSLIGYVDYLTGVALSLSVFYLAPVTLVAWFSTRWSAYFVSALSAIIWFFVDFLLLHIHAYAFVPFWNAAVRFGIFIIVAFVLARLKQSLESELQHAAEIQQRFLPSSIPDVPGVAMSGSTRPSHSVSGDYFDVLRYGESELGFCVADVVGHGVPAAILMSSLQAAAKIYAADKVTPGEFCRKLNRTITENTAPNKFITFFFGLLDTESNRLVYTNAGHNPPILLRNDGSFVLLEENDLVFGIDAEAHYRETEIQLECGDRVILFTDGVTELESPLGKQFQTSSLIEVVRENRHLEASELKNAILSELTAFSKGVFPDDITLLVVEIQENRAGSQESHPRERNYGKSIELHSSKGKAISHHFL